MVIGLFFLVLCTVLGNIIVLYNLLAAFKMLLDATKGEQGSV